MSTSIEETRKEQLTREEKAKKDFLQAMSDYGKAGKSDYTRKSAIARHEDPADKVSLPTRMSIAAGKRQLEQEERVQNATKLVERDFVCLYNEGGVAIKRILEKIYGSTGLPVRRMWGGEDVIPPVRNVQVGLDLSVDPIKGRPIYEEVPMESFSLPLIEAEFYLETWENEDNASMLKVQCTTKTEYAEAIEIFFEQVADEIRWNSIYKGQQLVYKSLDNGSYSLEYVNRFADPIFTYSDKVTHRLNRDLWDIIRFNPLYPADLQSTFKVLLYGALGTGKTGACNTTQALARDYGQTVIEYSPSGLPTTRDLGRFLGLCRRLGPTMGVVEDYEKFSSIDLSSVERSRLTNLIDGADKNDQVSILMTTNHPTKIDEALLRGQRMTAVIEIGMLDASGTERLLRKKLKDQLDPGTDFEEVWRATTDFGPAFLQTCFTKALQVNIGEYCRAHDIDIRELSQEQLLEIAKMVNAQPIGTDGLVGAAESLQGQVDLNRQVRESKLEKKRGLTDVILDGAVDFVQRYGRKFRFSRDGFSVVD